MLVAAILVAVAATCVGLIGLYADGMSDAPGQKSGVAPMVIGLYLVAALLLVLWLSGFHLNLISRD